MIIELQEVNKHPTKDFLIATYWIQHGNDLYPTKFNSIVSEQYKPGQYEIDFSKSTYKNRYGQLTIGNLVLNEV
ncbi:hypothetical protein GA0071314_0085 [Halomonas sp. HL-93]|nr:hypothetical protein GA0071314_0085 [Halomonas sp. HL-93]